MRALQISDAMVLRRLQGEGRALEVIQAQYGLFTSTGEALQFQRRFFQGLQERSDPTTDVSGLDAVIARNSGSLTEDEIAARRSIATTDAVVRTDAYRLALLVELYCSV